MFLILQAYIIVVILHIEFSLATFLVIIIIIKAVKKQNLFHFKEVNGVVGVHSVNVADKSKREKEIANITINTKLRPLNVLETRLKHEHVQSILEKVVSVYYDINQVWDYLYKLLLHLHNLDNTEIL